jgi:hypothetical protein
MTKKEEVVEMVVDKGELPLVVVPPPLPKRKATQQLLSAKQQLATQPPPSMIAVPSASGARSLRRKQHRGSSLASDLLG